MASTLASGLVNKHSRLARSSRGYRNDGARLGIRPTGPKRTTSRSSMCTRPKNGKPRAVRPHKEQEMRGAPIPIGENAGQSACSKRRRPGPRVPLVLAQCSMKASRGTQDYIINMKNIMALMMDMRCCRPGRRGPQDPVGPGTGRTASHDDPAVWQAGW